MAPPRCPSFLSLVFSIGTKACPLALMRSILMRLILSFISLASFVGNFQQVIVSLSIKLLKTARISYDSTPRSAGNGTTDPSSNR